MTRVVLAVLMACASVVTVSTESDKPVPISERAKGAETIVVAKVIEVTPTLERNQFGDQVIVSHAWLQVEESLKGGRPQVMPLDVEGGTVNGLTLRVSDMKPISQGERGVFFVTRLSSGANVPHRRGHGILKLDSLNRVEGTAETLDEVKRQVRQGLQ